MEKAKVREYCYGEQVTLAGWMSLIVLEGVIFGGLIMRSAVATAVLMILAIVMFVPLLFYRERAKVNETTGEIETKKGFWPLAQKRKYAHGELRRVYVSGHNGLVTSTLSLWCEDRAGNRVRLCTDGPECVDCVAEEGQELAEILGAPFDLTWSYTDARRKILSNRRPKWLAAWEMIALGGGLGLFMLYARAAERSALPFAGWLRDWQATPVGATSWGNIFLWLGSFMAITLLLIGVPLVIENKDHWARATKRSHWDR